MRSLRPRMQASALAIALIASVTGISPALANASGNAGVPGPPGAAAPYIVELRGDQDLADTETITGGTVERTFSRALHGGVVLLSPQQAADLKRDPRVKSIEPDGLAHAADIQLSPPWGLDRVDQRTRPYDASFAYPTTAGAGVTAYVVDTGINASHVEFGGRTNPGFTAIADGFGTSDCNGHGTHVSGTLAGSTYGLAKRARITPVRVLDCSAFGPWSGVIAGLDWIVADHAAGVPAVANLSLSGAAIATVDAAIRNVVADGVTVVVAAGNNGLDACGYTPGRVAEAITVGATTSIDSRPSWSNFGSCLDIFAPGDQISSAWSTSTTATFVDSGTSMASPHVAGAAALLLGDNPGLSPAAVASALLGNSTSGCVSGVGTGSPNRLLYVGSAPQSSCTPPATAPSAPASVTATAGRTSATVTWTPAFNGGSALTSQSVSVYKSGALAKTVLVSGTVTSTLVGTLTAGASYTFRVSATNALGTSPLSAASNAVIPLK